MPIEAHAAQVGERLLPGVQRAIDEHAILADVDIRASLHRAPIRQPSVPMGKVWFRAADSATFVPER